MKAYLGCGSHRPWDCCCVYLDKNPTGSALKWEFGEPIPGPDGFYDLILIQHSLMYIPIYHYDFVVDDCKRALMRGGRLIIKEDNPMVHKFRGRESECNEHDMIYLLAKNGFKIIDNPEIGEYINRVRGLRKGKHWLVEGVKI